MFIGRLIYIIIFLGLLSAAAVTLAGFLAPIYPPAEMFNHFRLFLILGLIISLTVSLLLKHRVFVILSSVIMSVNFIFVILSWSYAKPTIGAQAIAGATTLKLISFNMLYSNPRLDKIEQFLRQEQADIVNLQEFSPKHEILLSRLKDIYPHSFACRKQSYYCDLALLSKHPLKEPKSLSRTSVRPQIISANIMVKNNKYIQVIGTHIAWPFRPFKQHINMKWLSQYINSIPKSKIILGDFNHTPWSWRLTQFAHTSNLKRHGTFINSWPATKLFPVLLIDHVFSSDDIANINTKTGPHLHSDHLPIISKVIVR